MIVEPPLKELSIIVAIPCTNEPDIITTLDSLLNCEKPEGVVEVIVLINAKKTAPPSVVSQNAKTFESIRIWKQNNPADWLTVHACVVEDLTPKHAGAGWARKLAMDEAIRRFESIDSNGVICCFDADCVCAPNYFVEIENTFNDSMVSGCSIYFEHLTDSQKYPDHQNDGILCYELHLRYLTHAIRWTGAPYGYHTVGSSMAVRALDYVKVGGMNRRTAGEDFYFIHKIIPRGKFLNVGTTTVFPSARTSDRVPFGTGAAMNSVVNSGDSEYLTYDFNAFVDLYSLFSSKAMIYRSQDILEDLKHSVSDLLYDYLIHSNSIDELLSAVKTSKSELVFDVKFYSWFDAFKVIKFLNWSHTVRYSKSKTIDQAQVLLKHLGVEVESELNVVLFEYQKLDRLSF